MSKEIPAILASSIRILWTDAVHDCTLYGMLAPSAPLAEDKPRGNRPRLDQIVDLMESCLSAGSSATQIDIHK